MIISDLWPFTYNPVKSGICGLLAICSLLPVVESQGGRTGRADSSGGGLPGLAVERMEAVTIRISRCTGSLPYCDAQVYAVSPPGAVKAKEEATPLPLKDKAMALTRSYFNSTMFGLAVLLGHSNNVLDFHHPGAALRTFGCIKVHTHSSIFSRL
jgi:hypothetical protein